ncbi:conjugal transfer protein TraG, partial [Pseudomonas aeruginosa]|nr:conjugal transfer protein TraG [Pseudomonas aeruginosa]
HTNFDPLIDLKNAFGDMFLNFVMEMMFIVLPGFWVAALAWVGVRVGSISQMLSADTDGAKSAGGKGADLAIKAAKAK